MAEGFPFPNSRWVNQDGSLTQVAYFLLLSLWNRGGGPVDRTVTVSGSPAVGSIAGFSGPSSITNVNLTGDVTTGGGTGTTIAALAVSTGKIAASAVTLAKIQNATAGSRLLGSGSAGAGSSYAEITLGAGLSMAGTTLSGTGGTVTHTVGALTSGQLLVGNGGGDLKTGNLSGDVTTAGSGAVTLATVNASPGTYALASVTVNGKGLVTNCTAATTTGSGSVVLATSPTLVTPNIGVATGTSLTVSGTLGVASGVTWRSGTGSPETVVTAPVGSLYSRTDGGAATSLYVKESGSGNTGWVGK